MPPSLPDADVDNDGDMDVLASFFGFSIFVHLHELSWLDNNGDGTFTKRRVDLVAYEPVSSVMVDMDGDGFMDVRCVALRLVVRRRLHLCVCV